MNLQPSGLERLTLIKDDFGTGVVFGNSLFIEHPQILFTGRTIGRTKTTKSTSLIHLAETR